MDGISNPEPLIIMEVYDLEPIVRGDDHPGIEFQLFEDAEHTTPIDITGHSFALAIARSYKQGKRVLEVTDGDGITITDPVNGTFILDQFSTVGWVPGDYYYDLEWITGAKITIVGGLVPVVEDVTGAPASPGRRPAHPGTPSVDDRSRVDIVDQRPKVFISIAPMGPPGPPGSGNNTFAGLDDTPADYAGQSGKVVKVKGTEDGLEFDDESGGIPDAPSDGEYYGRTDGTWAQVTEEAPTDGNQYVRQNGEWNVAPTNELPTGGTTRQVLEKTTATDYDVQWANRWDAFFDAGNQSGTWSPDLDDGFQQNATATGALQIDPPTNTPDGASGNIVVNVNGQTITFGSGFKWLDDTVPDASGAGLLVLSYVVQGTNLIFTGSTVT